MRLKFSDYKEFLAECFHDIADGRIRRGIVRTSLKHMQRRGEPIVEVSVIASYWTDGGLVELSHYCGEYMPGCPAKDDGSARAMQVHENILELLRGHKLELRHGEWVE